MDTRSRKRKQLSRPPNPYAIIYTTKRRASAANPRVKDLRSRRVFSPASASDVKPAVDRDEKHEKPVVVVEEEEIGGKTGFLDLGGSQNGGTSPDAVEEIGIGGKIGFLDVGVDEIGEMEGDLKVEVGGGNGEEDELIQTTPLERNEEKKVLGEERVLQKDGFGGEGERQEEEPKPKVKQGVHSRYRSRLYKNPSCFSYKRLLPFLMDLTKDDSDAPVIHPTRKAVKPEEERYSPPLSASQDFPIDGVSKEILTKSPEEPFTESTTPEAPNTIALPVVSNLVIEKPASQTLEDIYASSKSESASLHETNPPLYSSSSLAKLKSSSTNEHNGLDRECEPSNGDGKTESYKDESVQSTPPDSDVVCKLGPNTTKDCALESSLKNGSVCDKNKRADESEKDKKSNSNAKLGVLVPCSRKKLYRNPGSFSYRRLLPYLTNLAKNDTNTIGTSPCQNVDKTLNEGHTSSFVDSQEILKDGTTKGVLPTEHCVGVVDASNLESAQMTPPIGTSSVSLPELKSMEEQPVEVVTENPNVESIIQETQENTIVSEVGCSDIGNPSNVDVERVLQVTQDMLDKDDNVDQVHQITHILHETNVQIKSSPLPLAEDSSSLPQKEDSSSFLMQKSSTDAKSTMELAIPQETPNKQPLVHLENSPTGSSSGILKRHPRGCRGICSCLNCASFRLHAERAFEFSKTQMLDTQDLTMELVKELSGIRTLLENSANGEEHSVQVPQLQAKEACMKALRAEENAKSYLKQMNEDLEVHCRTPCLERPKVRFANKMEVRLTR